MNYLITGGAGNIGSSLARELSNNMDNQIVILDNLSTGHLSKIPIRENVKFIKCDVNDYSDIAPVFGRFQFDYVFHYAAVVGVQRTLENPLKVLNDCKGMENILKLSKNTGVRRIFYSSSSEVYGEPFEIPQREHTTPLNSKLPYAIVKNISEAYCRSYYQEYGLEYTIFRFFNTYGPNQSEDFVVPRFLKRALSGQDIVIYGDGSQTRSFCYIDDNIETCVKAISDPETINEVINVGSDIEISVLELAQKIVKLTGNKSKIIHKAPLPEGDMSRRCPDISKMKKLLNRDLKSLDEGLLALISIYKQGS
ncbi:NAD-dependent epimerase/dehydratase family protein [Aquiflexum sp. TKW24L]|uniref:NAD-dependent epimerase/dehydratase family protein n=1 Tax=Aquiflexum sp. TKW24L TaxID=2942212 RepID=UPI0020C0F3A1|nr:NAD-dependent epimerase/dehydratase family protein [Aquiflexum sp. TKW24L]MCL6261225.1 NAD-dependent epimerase/dehydratase family protein [Aquiflexum sp. TKW24L]